MYTQCPECHTPRKLGVRQLQKEQVNVRCRKCSLEYDAKKQPLTEEKPASTKRRSGKKKKARKTTQTRKNQTAQSKSPKTELIKNKEPSKKTKAKSSKKTAPDKTKPSLPPQRPENRQDELFPWEKAPEVKSTFRWDFGFYGLCILLITQIIYFEGYPLSQNPGIRSLLSAACHVIGCPLPPYKNLKQLNIIGSSLKPITDNSLKFEATFINDAIFPQEHPRLKLTILKFNGASLAERIFNPGEYLPENPGNKIILPKEKVQIGFSIIAPKDKIGGYVFDLI